MRCLLLAACATVVVGCRLASPPLSPSIHESAAPVASNDRVQPPPPVVVFDDAPAASGDVVSSLRGHIQPVVALQSSESDAEPLPSAEPPAPKRLGASTSPSATEQIAPPSALSLLEALEHGLAFNPDLVTLRQQENVSRAAVDVAATYPFNPILQSRILPYGRFKRGGDTSVYNYVLFWQTFELAHQGRYRSQNAAAALGGVRWNIAQAELQNLTRTQQLYFTALYQRGLWDLAQANDRLNEQLLDVTQKQFNAGAASASDVALVRLDAQSSRQQQRLAEANFQTALEALRQQLNLPLGAPLALDGDLAAFPWLSLGQVLDAMNALSDSTLTDSPGSSESNTISTLEDAAAQFAALRPDVLAAQSNVMAARANMSLAQASRVPNLMAGPFYIRDASGTMNLGLQAQVEVPIANGGRPLVRQRYAELEQQATAWQQQQTRAQVEAQVALRRYQRSLALFAEVQADLPDDLPTELARLEELYRRGEVDVTRAIQARVSLLQLRRTYLDSLHEVGQAAALVTQSTGLPPHVLLGAGD